MKTHAIDISTEVVRKFMINSNSIMGGAKKIDGFGIARVDPKVSVTDTVKAMADLVS